MEHFGFLRKETRSFYLKACSARNRLPSPRDQALVLRLLNQHHLPSRGSKRVGRSAFTLLVEKNGEVVGVGPCSWAAGAAGFAFTATSGLVERTSNAERRCFLSSKQWPASLLLPHQARPQFLGCRRVESSVCDRSAMIGLSTTAIRFAMVGGTFSDPPGSQAPFTTAAGWV